MNKSIGHFFGAKSRLSKLQGDMMYRKLRFDLEIFTLQKLSAYPHDEKKK